MLSGVDGLGALTILGKSGSHFLFERDRLVCSCQSRDVREIIRALRRSHGSVQLPRPRAIGAVEVFFGSTQDRDSEGNPALTLRQAWIGSVFVGLKLGLRLALGFGGLFAKAKRVARGNIAILPPLSDLYHLEEGFKIVSSTFTILTRTRTRPKLRISREWILSSTQTPFELEAGPRRSSARAVVCGAHAHATSCDGPRLLGGRARDELVHDARVGER